jgi:hypothetical protein
MFSAARRLAVARSVLLILSEAGGAVLISPRSSTEIIGIFVEELFLFDLELFLVALAFSTMLIPSDFPQYGSTRLFSFSENIHNHLVRIDIRVTQLHHLQSSNVHTRMPEHGWGRTE